MNTTNRLGMRRRGHRHLRHLRPAPEAATRRIEQALASVPRLPRREVREALHAPTGEPFTITLVGGRITAIQAATGAGMALIGTADPLDWAEREAWWLDPPAAKEDRRSA